jgi:hypothetical protein
MTENNNITIDQIERFYNLRKKEGLTVDEIVFQFIVAGVTKEQYIKWVEKFHPYEFPSE